MTDSIPEEWLALPRTPKEAKAVGSKHYFSGKQCQRGHLVPRLTSANKCTLCAREDNRERIPQIGAWKAANRDRVRASDQRYRERNREVIRKRSRDWSQKQRDEGTNYADRQNESNREYLKQRLATDPVFKWTARQRSRLSKRLAEHGGTKDQSSDELFGCTYQELRDHLEAQFTEGMTWENYGQWHLDHKRPCSSFDLSDPEQQKQCFHYTNLQPLWGEDNLRKSDTWED